MPDLTSLPILLVVAAGAAVFVAAPFLNRRLSEAPLPRDDASALSVRHRIAIETLRDVEADRRAGLLDDASYAALQAEAEERAAQTLADLEATGRGDEAAAPADAKAPVRRRWSSRRVAAIVGGGLAILLVGGSLLPAPFSLANGVIVDQQLAAAQAAERTRQTEITQLRRQLITRPNDPATLVRLATLYLDGGSDGDRQTAARLLLFAIGLDKNTAEAYRLLISTYISSGDYSDAAKATDAFARIAANSPDVAFFRGIIALQGTRDRQAAVRWFDVFLKAAPNDPRAAMVRSLRAEAAGSLP
jgi:cytochrome c-type biogenesis protein CcmH/NrfG